MKKMTYKVVSTHPNTQNHEIEIAPSAYDNTERAAWTLKLAMSYIMARARHLSPGTTHTILRRPEGSAEPWETAREYETARDGVVKRTDQRDTWRGGLALAL